MAGRAGISAERARLSLKKFRQGVNRDLKIVGVMDFRSDGAWERDRVGSQATSSQSSQKFLLRSGQSGFTPQNLTTLAHLAVSSAMNLAKSAVEPANAVKPRSESLDSTFRSARAAFLPPL
jgi:hypothetical protein